MRTRSKLPFGFGRALLAVMLAQASLGLLFAEQYRDPLWARAAWKGNDWVTLAVAAPVLLLAQQRAARGSARGALLWLGLLGYGVYNYAFYLFGAALNAFFPLYVATFLLSAVALGRALLAVDAEALAPQFAPGARASAVCFGVVGGGLSIAWLAQWAGYIVTGDAPSLGPDAFRLIAALDLTVMAPLLLAAAVALWRRGAWAPVLAALAGVKGATYTLVLTAGSAVGASLEVPGAATQIPIWAALSVVMVAATAWALRPPPAREATASSRGSPRPASPSS